MIYSCGSEGDCWLELVGSGPTLGLGACCIALLTGIGARGATIGLNAGLPIMFGGPPLGRTGCPGGAFCMPPPRGPNGLPGLGGPAVGSPDFGPVADLPP